MKKGLYVSERPESGKQWIQPLQQHALEILAAGSAEASPEEIHFILIESLERQATPLVSEYRQRFPSAAIFVLSAKRSEEDLLGAFTHGADDYQCLPITPREIATRLLNIIKRKSAEVPVASVPFSDLLDQGNHLLHWKGRRIQLTPTECKLLTALMQNRKSLTTRQQLMQAVWEDRADLSSKALDIHLYHLRRKLQTNTNGEWMIKTVTNRGFYLDMAP